MGRGDLAVASLAALLAAADTYVVVLALPDIMTGVGLGLDELQRASPIISMFLLGYVAVLPLVGRIADLRGRLPVLVACLLLFALGSMLTASAADLGLVVIGRAIQGAGGGGLVPVTLTLVADLWVPDRRGVRLGVVGAVQEIGSVAGPLYGAGILAVAGWRAIFWVNLAGAGVLIIVLLPDDESHCRPSGFGSAGCSPRWPSPHGPSCSSPPVRWRTTSCSARPTCPSSATPGGAAPWPSRPSP